MENVLIELSTIDCSSIENIIIENKKASKREPVVVIVTPEEYRKNSGYIDSLKLPQIKDNLRFYKNSMYISPEWNNTCAKELRRAINSVHDFALTGTKPKLLERLHNYFIQENKVIVIQRAMRGRFVRCANELRGKHMHISKYVNDTDFYTMEPIHEIEYTNLFSYTDEQGFTYGFELSSLVELMKQCRMNKLINPYTRSDITHLRPIIRRLSRLNHINQTKREIPKREVIKPRSTEFVRRPRSNTDVDTHQIDDSYDHDAMVTLIREMRSKTNGERARALFAEIDSLGNYTRYEWFSQLDKTHLYRFFRYLKDIWSYRAQIPVHVKRQICPLWDPFSIVSASTVHPDELDEEQIESVCLTIMEDMIYTGISTEFKTLGAFHVLSALTIVSRSARDAIPWLYESLL